jgi:release factor glutamine methyltransferase
VLEVIQRSTDFLARKGVESPRLQVELLLGHVLKMQRLKLYLDFERALSEPELEQVRELVKRRGGNREPLQHLIGSTSFCGLEIHVNRHVLIPRPETEVLAERAWKFLQARCKADVSELSGLDFGTGSGCLAIAIAKHAPAQMEALDISRKALEVARENIAQHQLAERVRLYESDGFEALPSGSCYDLIVANPPYIPSAEIDQLAPEVKDHDPRLALDGGLDGLQAFKQLAREGAGFLKPAGELMCEFGDGQAEPVQALFTSREWKGIEIVADLSGRARILVARRGES